MDMVGAVTYTVYEYVEILTLWKYWVQFGSGSGILRGERGQQGRELQHWYIDTLSGYGILFFQSAWRGGIGDWLKERKEFIP